MKRGKEPRLNVAGIQECSSVNGPGKRLVIWLQGCRLRCPGCINPEFQPEIPKFLVPWDAIKRFTLALSNIEGVTYTGGEPTLQAKPLALLSESLQKNGLTVMCYTGYTIEELRSRKDYWIERLLGSIDILIDGPYEKDKTANLPWRSTSNQRVHFLTERYRHLADYVNTPTSEVEFLIGEKGFTVVGFWQAEFLERLQKILGG